MHLANEFIEVWREYHVSAYIYKKCMKLAQKFGVRTKC